jgi:hypothetical protein
MRITLQRWKKHTHIRLQEVIDYCGPSKCDWGCGYIIAFQISDSHKLKANLIEHMYYYK